MTETPTLAASQDKYLLRAAVLSVFDLDWLEPHLSEVTTEEGDRLAEFLASSCERVVDVHGASRWRLRDGERLRVFRTVSRGALLAALDAAPRRSDEPLQRVLEQYLHGTLPPVERLDSGAMAGLLQLRRWLGDQAGLPSEEALTARLEWLDLLAPLQRLLARGFVGRQDVLAAVFAHVHRGEVSGRVPDCFVIEGVGGSGKSTILARLVESTRQEGDLVCYVSLDRSWLVQGGPWALLDEMTRQVGLHLSAAGAPVQSRVAQLRRRTQQLARRAGYSDVASRSVQQVEDVPPELLADLAALVAGRRLVLVLDTLEELARRDESLAYACSRFLEKLQEAMPRLRAVAAGRARPLSAFPVARVWRLTGLGDEEGVRLLSDLTGLNEDQPLLLRIVRSTAGHPLSLHLAADVLRRTGRDPTQLIALGEGDIQGQLYSRLLEHIKDPRARAIAHPGLIVRRITPDVIRLVLAEPCRIAPLDERDADAVFRALQGEATLCEPSPDGDGALMHRADVRSLMLPAITRATPGKAREIHEEAVRYYAASPRDASALVARREELYHRLMLKQPRPELDRRWTPEVADELAVVMDELPAESQLYLAGRTKGLRLDPWVRAEADDEAWRHSVRLAVESLVERGQVESALALLQERRGQDGRVLLPDLEIQALERLGRTEEALALAEAEQQRASALGHDTHVRDLILQRARILERLRRFDEAWTLLYRLAVLDRAARTRPGVHDDEVRLRDLVVLSSMLRVARHTGREVENLRRETADLTEHIPARVLARSPSLLRDLAAEIGDLSPRLLELATDVRGTDLVGEQRRLSVDPFEHGGSGDTTISKEQFASESDDFQGYI